MKMRFSDEQVISILSETETETETETESEAGVPGSGPGSLPQVCYFRRHLLHLAQEIWRHELPEVKRLKSPAEDNARLAKLLAEALQVAKGDQDRKFCRQTMSWKP